MEHELISIITFLGIFLVGTGVVHLVTQRFSFPFTIALLIVGFVAQFLSRLFGFHAAFEVSPELIFYILLPALLFEAALHINVHEFKLQFKTISFFATFGLLVSVFAIAVMLALFAHLPFTIALLFGTIISATDPIAVLALFKTLGAPRRLALIADGESMFNDATGVIVFRIVSGFVIAHEALRPVSLAESTLEFLYVFVGSIIVGFLLGLVVSWGLARFAKERIILAAVTTGVALGVFTISEHVLHLSGVITTVILGLTIGNFGRPRLPSSVMHFVEEFWGYAGFLSLSFVFFFAAFQLDFGIFEKEIGIVVLAIIAVLVGRAVSVYLTAFLSNVLPLFKNEPNIPLSWQHILNWGGLRGVIPLVLVYSLPDDFSYKPLMLQLTLATLLFTLIVNGMTIRWLLLRLKLHIPRNEEKIIADELELFKLNEKRQKLKALPKREFKQNLVQKLDDDLKKKEEQVRDDLLSISSYDQFLLSLRMQALEIERTALRDLFEKGRFTEVVYHEFLSELDLQQDALEYPHLFARSIGKGGHISAGSSYRKRLVRLRRIATRTTWANKLLGVSEESLVRDRYGLLRARLFTSYAVLEYLDRVSMLIDKKQLLKAIKLVREDQEQLINKNSEDISSIEKKYPHIVTEYQEQMIKSLITA